MKSITSTASDETGEFDTLDEALAFAIQGATPGTVISVHSEDCALSQEDADEDTKCTCDSWDLTVGAEA